MIKREYTYFVAFQAQHISGDVRQCEVVHVRFGRINNHECLTKLRESLMSNVVAEGFRCDKIIFTSITLLSAKWVRE